MEPLPITFTTFLKISAIPTITGKIGEVRRFTKSGGYDFYKALKRLTVALAAKQIDLAEATKKANAIKREPERKHTLEATKKIGKWLNEQDDLKLAAAPRGAFKSKSGLISIRAEPELAFKNQTGNTTVLYLWNLAKPELKKPLAGEGLRFLNRVLPKDSYTLGIFDLRKMEIRSGDDIIAAANEAQLDLDLMILEAIWLDIHDPSLSQQDTVSHIASLKLPPPAPPPTL